MYHFEEAHLEAYWKVDAKSISHLISLSPRKTIRISYSGPTSFLEHKKQVE